jgi:hypothetical protein
MMIDTEVLHSLMRNIQMAYDIAAINAVNAGHTKAVVAEAAVREALLCAEGNGMITVTPREEWPEWISSTPPYHGDGAWGEVR